MTNLHFLFPEFLAIFSVNSTVACVTSVFVLGQSKYDAEAEMNNLKIHLQYRFILIFSYNSV